MASEADSERAAAMAELKRMEALAVVQGELLGVAPLLWLIREALDLYLERWIAWSRHDIDPTAFKDTSQWLIKDEFRLADIWRYGQYDGVLVRVGPRFEPDQCLDVPNASLALHDRVKADPVLAYRVLQRIAKATPERPKPKGASGTAQ